VLIGAVFTISGKWVNQSTARAAGSTVRQGPAGSGSASTLLTMGERYQIVTFIRWCRRVPDPAGPAVRHPPADRFGRFACAAGVIGRPS